MKGRAAASGRWSRCALSMPRAGGGPLKVASATRLDSAGCAAPIAAGA